MEEKQFGGYELLDKIDQGGMAEIYRARRTGPHGFEKIVAIKRILPHLSRNKDFVAMFSSEARVAAQLQHPNIVEIYDYGRVDDVYYIAMEYVHGLNLNDLITLLSDSNTSLGLDHCIYIIKKVCAALQYAHFLTDFRGRPMEIVHRDVNPKNIMIAFSGAVKLMDFGIALAQTRCYETQVNGMIKGKLAYLSPEQVASIPLDHRSDLFSLGIVFYELITGIRPFQSDSEFGLLRTIEKEDPIPPQTLIPSLPGAINDIILKCLRKDRNKRYLRASDIASDLEKYEAENGMHCSQGDFADFLRKKLGVDIVESPVVDSTWTTETLTEIIPDEVPDIADAVKKTKRALRRRGADVSSKPIKSSHRVSLDRDPRITPSTLSVRDTGKHKPAVQAPKERETGIADKKQSEKTGEKKASGGKSSYGPVTAEKISRATGDAKDSSFPREPALKERVPQTELAELLDEDWQPGSDGPERHRTVLVFLFVAIILGVGAFLVFGRQGVFRLLGLGPSMFQGRLSVTVTPPEATLEIDFKSRDDRPYETSVRWPVGTSHTIHAAHPAYRPVTLRLEVNDSGGIVFPETPPPGVSRTFENGEIRCQIALIPAYIDVQITSRPKGASVFVNGIDTEKKTPMTFSFSTGETAVVRLVKKGYEPVEKTFEPKDARDQASLAFTLRRIAKPTSAPVQKGKIIVHAPYPVDIYIGKRRLARHVTVKTLRVTPGKVSLRLKNNELFLDKTETIRVRSGRTSTVNLDPPGFLIVNAEPPGCRLFIGERSLGTAPGRFQLATGLYNVTFVWEQCGDKKAVWVKIRPNQNKTLPKVVGCR